MFMIIFKNCNICGWWWWLINQIGDNCDWSCNDCVFFCDSCCWHCKNSDHIKCSIFMMPPTAFFAIWITNKSQAIRCSDHWITTALPSKSRHSKLSVAEPVCSDKKYPKYIGNKKKHENPSVIKTVLHDSVMPFPQRIYESLKVGTFFRQGPAQCRLVLSMDLVHSDHIVLNQAPFTGKGKKKNGVQNSMLLTH